MRLGTSYSLRPNILAFGDSKFCPICKHLGSMVDPTHYPASVPSAAVTWAAVPRNTVLRRWPQRARGGRGRPQERTGIDRETGGATYCSRPCSMSPENEREAPAARARRLDHPPRSAVPRCGAIPCGAVARGGRGQPRSGGSDGAPQHGRMGSDAPHRASVGVGRWQRWHHTSGCGGALFWTGGCRHCPDRKRSRSRWKKMHSVLINARGTTVISHHCYFSI
jgi:hypothetical protein